MKPEHRASSGITFLLRNTMLFGIIGILCATAMFTAFLAYGNIPNRFYQVLVVSSGSMAPAINAGDLIVITRPPSVIQPGMVLTMQVGSEIVTHRVIETGADGAPVTKGDANPVRDQWESGSVSVVGLYQFRIPSLGAAIQNITRANFRHSTYSWFQDADQVGFSIVVLEAEETATPTPSPTPTASPTAEPTDEPTPSPSPIVWDKSSLEFNTQGFTCDQGGIVWAVIQNTGESMTGAVVWELYLDKTMLIAAGEVPAVGKTEFYSIESRPTAAGKYKFKVFQRPAHPGQGVLWSEEIDYDPQACAAPVVQPTEPPAVIVPPVIEPIIEPTAIADPTETPEEPATLEPPTAEPPTPEPPTPEPPTPEPPTPEPPAPEPTLEQPTPALDSEPTSPPAQEAPVD